MHTVDNTVIHFLIRIVIYEEEERKELFHAIVEEKAREDSEEDIQVSAENEDFYFCFHNGWHKSVFACEQIELPIQVQNSFYLLEQNDSLLDSSLIILA